MEEDLRVAFAGSLQLILDLVDARHHGRVTFWVTNDSILDPLNVLW